MTEINDLRVFNLSASECIPTYSFSLSSSETFSKKNSCINDLFQGFKMIKELETANPFNCSSLNKNQNLDQLYNNCTNKRYKFDYLLKNKDQTSSLLDILYKVTG
jgi:hypothetical protein